MPNVDQCHIVCHCNTSLNIDHNEKGIRWWSPDADPEWCTRTTHSRDTNPTRDKQVPNYFNETTSLFVLKYQLTRNHSVTLGCDDLNTPIFWNDKPPRNCTGSLSTVLYCTDIIKQHFVRLLPNANFNIRNVHLGDEIIFRCNYTTYSGVWYENDALFRCGNYTDTSYAMPITANSGYLVGVVPFQVNRTYVFNYLVTDSLRGSEYGSGRRFTITFKVEPPRTQKRLQIVPQLQTILTSVNVSTTTPPIVTTQTHPPLPYFTTSKIFEDTPLSTTNDGTKFDMQVVSFICLVCVLYTVLQIFGLIHAILYHN